MMKESKDVVVLIAKIGNAVGKSLEDGKIGLDDLVNLAPVTAALVAAIAKCSDIPAEFASATDADRDELAKFFCAEFSIPQAAAELMVEKTVQVAIAIWNMIK